MHAIFLADIHFNPIIPSLALFSLAVLGLGFVLRKLKQPFLLAYIIAGVLLSDQGLGLFTNADQIALLGDVGIVLLLFFIGMETNLPDLVQQWKVAIGGTIGQVLLSVGLVALVGWPLDWSWSRILMLGFIISLSSSAVVIRLLQDSGEIRRRLGRKVLSILLMQDVLVVPMLVVASYLGGTRPHPEDLWRQAIGAVLVILFFIWLLRKQHVRLPYAEYFEQDHELQVFAALIICFGFAFVTSAFSLSAALGAFLAGLMIHADKHTRWLHDSLESFRILFVALFFVYVGMQLNLDFLSENATQVVLLLVLVLVTNHFVNAVILRWSGCGWAEALYGGALLAQIGELSFLLAATGYQIGGLSDYGYQMTLAVISLSLFVSPFWIALSKRLLGFVTARERIEVARARKLSGAAN